METLILVPTFVFFCREEGLLLTMMRWGDVGETATGLIKVLLSLSVRI